MSSDKPVTPGEAKPLGVTSSHGGTEPKAVLSLHEDYLRKRCSTLADRRSKHMAAQARQCRRLLRDSKG